MGSTRSDRRGAEGRIGSVPRMGVAPDPWAATPGSGAAGRPVSRDANASATFRAGRSWHHSCSSSLVMDIRMRTLVATAEVAPRIDPERHATGLRAGADGCVGRPLEPGELAGRDRAPGHGPAIRESPSPA